MSDRIRILQLGKENWNLKYRHPEYVEIIYTEHVQKEPKKPYELVILDRELLEGELKVLRRATKAYTLFVMEQVSLQGDTKTLYEEKKGERLAHSEAECFLQWEARNYFREMYGEKFNPMNLSVSQDYKGSVSWEGNCSVSFCGDFGEELKQIAFWRNNIPIDGGQALELWLEYEKDREVEISLEVTQFVNGSLSDIQQTWSFSEEELKDLIILDNQREWGVIFVSLQARGEGRLKIKALHNRYSRRGRGCFMPGGERFVTGEREEIFAYFDPGNRKPPLNIYFSGYKTRQGFEGYHMMRAMGCPFLLITETRLEGGSFYVGTGEYEQLLKSVIKKYMEELGFSGSQVVMSGLSMGTYAALYYGCDIRPHAIILGKPLANIGTVAANERLRRPGGFPTSLDVLHKLCGDTTEEAVLELNGKLWKRFDAKDWSRTKFIVTYMIEDDYDDVAYQSLITHLKSEGVQLYGKGFHGRHNDNDMTISWFVDYFKKILSEDFKQGI